MLHLKTKLTLYFISFLIFLSNLYASQESADIMVVLDNSGSMKKNDPQFLTHTSLRIFVSKLRADDSLGLIIFSDKPLLASHLTLLSEERTKEEILKNLSNLNYTGRYTNIPVGIERGLRELKQYGRPEAIKIIILLTDGIIDTGDKERDNELSRWLKESLIPDCLRSQVNIISIAFTESADYKLLQEIAQKSYGQYYMASSIEELNFVFEKIREFINKKREMTKVSSPITPQSAIESEKEKFTNGKEKEIVQVKEEERDEDKEVEKNPISTLPIDREQKRLQWRIVRWVGLIVAISIFLLHIFFFIKNSYIKLRIKKSLIPEEGELEIGIPFAQLVDLGNVLEESKITLKKRITTVGRSRKNDIVIRNSKVSNQHAQIIYKDGSFYVKDLKSTNGTYLNGERIKKEELLQNGSIVAFGRFRFIFSRLSEDVTVLDEEILAASATIPYSDLKEKMTTRKKINYECKSGHSASKLLPCDSCGKVNYCKACMKRVGEKNICPDCYMFQKRL